MLSSLTVKQRALDLGFDLAGIAPLGVWEDLEFSRQWVEKGFNGEMRYLENPKRFDPRLILPSAKSVICVGLIYNVPLPYSTEVDGSKRRQKAEGRKQKKRATNQLSNRGISGSRASSETEVIGSAGQRNADREQAAVTGFQSPVSSFEFPFSIPTFPVSDPGPRAWIARYAWGRDYHEIMRARLERLRAALEELAPGIETRVFVDTGPVVERAFARFAGVGWMGKNTCIINEEKGSWFFLGVILTSLELPPDLPAPDRCGSCTACLQACPTGALVEPYVMDASRCISYLTIELRGPIPEEFRPKIGGNVFGCDICQDVCPWNGGHQPSAFSNQRGFPTLRQSADKNCARQTATTRAPEFHPIVVEPIHPMITDGGTPQQPATNHGPRTTGNEQPTTDLVGFSLFNPPLGALASMTQESFRRIFGHSPIKRAKYQGWLRNLCVAMGNSGDDRFVPWLERAAQHSDPTVREHAAWALGRLRAK
jgi:epoxyqueuosine reductase